jgi:hypothetical protein
MRTCGLAPTCTTAGRSHGLRPCRHRGRARKAPRVVDAELNGRWGAARCIGPAEPRKRHCALGGVGIAVMSPPVRRRSEPTRQADAPHHAGVVAVAGDGIDRRHERLRCSRSVREMTRSQAVGNAAPGHRQQSGRIVPQSGHSTGRTAHPAREAKPRCMIGTRMALLDFHRVQLIQQRYNTARSRRCQSARTVGTKASTTAPVFWKGPRQM